MINFSFHPDDPSEPPPAVTDPAYWRRAIRLHCDPPTAAPVTAPAPPPCRQCRHTWPCPLRRRAERALFGALRKRRQDGGGDHG